MSLYIAANRFSTLPLLKTSLFRPRCVYASCIEFARFVSTLRTSKSTPVIIPSKFTRATQQKAPNLQEMLQRVKENTAKRGHEGLKISYDNAIQACTEERHFKEIKEVLENLQKLMTWRKELAQSICYEASELAKQMRTPVDVEKKPTPRSYFSQDTSLDTLIGEVIKNQEQVALQLQTAVQTHEALKTTHDKVYKHPVKLSLNPVKNLLALHPPALPVSHQWEKKELPQELHNALRLYVVHELQPLQRACVRELHKATCLLNAIQAVLSKKSFQK